MPMTRRQGITNRSKAKSQNARKRGPTPGFPAKSNTLSRQLLPILQADLHSSRTTMELRLIQAFTSRLLTGRPAGTTRWRHAALPCRLENLWQAAGLQDPSCHSRMTGIEISRRKTLHYAMWPTSTQAMAMRSMSSMPLASMKGPAPAPLSSRTRHFPRLRALLRNVQMMSYGNFGSGPQAQP